MYQESSYVIGVETEQEIFDGIYISCDTPTNIIQEILNNIMEKTFNSRRFRT